MTILVYRTRDVKVDEIVLKTIEDLGFIGCKLDVKHVPTQFEGKGYEIFSFLPDNSEVINSLAAGL